MCKNNIEKKHQDHYAVDNLTFVKYIEANHNWYRTPTKWEKFKLSVKAVLKSVFVLPFTWLYQAVKCWGCQLKCKKDVETLGLKSSNSLLEQRVNELEAQNSIMRQHLNSIWAEEEAKAKKKAAKKRPSSKKKRKAT